MIMGITISHIKLAKEFLASRGYQSNIWGVDDDTKI